MAKKKELQVQDVIDITGKAERREKRRTRLKGEIRQRPTPSNLFPFSPARPDRPNPLGLQLDKWDVRILRSIQEHGFKPIREFCKFARVPEKKFYERFRVNRDLPEAMKLLAFSNLAVAFPKAMATLTEKFSENAKWAELYLKVVGLLGETGDSNLKLIKEKNGQEPELTEIDVDKLIEWSGKEKANED